MKIRLFTVGRGGSDLAAFEAEFLKRLQGFADVQVVELPEGRAKQMSQRKQEEEKHIQKRVSPGYVLFDEGGLSLSSIQWADYLRTLPGDASLDFVIGGAAGVSDSIRAQAGRCWSLSKLTLPHQLVRAMVLEQLYRAFTIIQGHPYHRV